MKAIRSLARPAFVLLAAAAGCLAPPWRAKPPSRDPLRHTPLVDLFNACKNSVVLFTATRVEEKVESAPDGKGPTKRVRTTHTQWGTGCILHEAGYVVGSSHMLQFEGARTATLWDGTTYPVRLIAADQPNDLAVFKMDTGHPLKPFKLGQSRTVLVGEPAITIGNPFGIGFTMASGIVSGVGRATKTEFALLTDMIQTDASINPGSSGGPLLNIYGELIGICASAKMGAENIGFAISTDRVRAVLPELLAPEGRYGFVLGLKVARGEPVTITEVAKGSPAESAGIRVGDVLAAIAKQPVRNELDFCFLLTERKATETLPFKLLRRGRPFERSVTLGQVKLRPAETVAGLVNGLDFAHYHGQWKELPDFDRLKPATTGTIATFDLGNLKGKEWVGIKYTGYIEVPADGVYIFSTRSDDGSRLYIGDRLVVDNDGLHPVIEKRGFISLKAGKHPIKVTFFQGPGDIELKVFYEGPGLKRQEVPASALFRPAK